MATGDPCKNYDQCGNKCEKGKGGLGLCPKCYQADKQKEYKEAKERHLNNVFGGKRILSMIDGVKTAAACFYADELMSGETYSRWTTDVGQILLLLGERDIQSGAALFATAEKKQLKAANDLAIDAPVIEATDAPPIEAVGTTPTDEAAPADEAPSADEVQELRAKLARAEAENALLRQVQPKTAKRKRPAGVPFVSGVNYPGLIPSLRGNNTVTDAVLKEVRDNLPKTRGKKA